MNTLFGQLRNLAIVSLAVAAVPMNAATPALAAGGNMAKVDIVSEGIDLAPIYVDSNANGYTGSEQAKHKYMVRVFAKASGQNRVYRVSIHALKGGVLFFKDVGKTEGWDVYGKSHELWALPRDIGWLTTPKEACDANLKKMVAAGKTKAQVLSDDRKVTAVAQIYFTAYADSKMNNKRGAHSVGGSQPHNASTIYKVPVVCRMDL